MSTVRSGADELQKQMADIRSRLRRDVRDVVHDAAGATDWRRYITNRPWLAIGAAFAAGFVLVPKRSKPSTIVVEREAKGNVEIRPVVAPKSSGFRPVRWLFGAVAPIALRAAQSYALNYVENLLQSNPAVASRPGPGSPFGRPATDARESARRF